MTCDSIRQPLLESRKRMEVYLLGRSSYLPDRVLGYPDLGAKAVAMWLRAVADAWISLWQ